MNNNYKLHLYFDGKYRISIPITESAAQLIGALSGKNFKEGYVWTTIDGGNVSTTDGHGNVSNVTASKPLDHFFINKQDDK